MQAYEQALKGQDTRLVVSPNSDVFRFFNDPQGRRLQGARNGAEPTTSGAGATTGNVR